MMMMLSLSLGHTTPDIGLGISGQRHTRGRGHQSGGPDIWSQVVTWRSSVVIRDHRHSPGQVTHDSELHPVIEIETSDGGGIKDT